jgi:hypothetical protein
MYILLILLAFILLSLSLFESDSNSIEHSYLFKIRLANIKAFIGVAFFSYIICEILSLFNIFSFNYVLISWLLIDGGIIYLNKEKITSIYKLTNKQIYNDDIGHIKPLIGKSKILLDKSGYTIDNKKYSLEKGKKLIEKASTEHPRKVYRNNQLLNGFYFVLQKYGINLYSPNYP